MNGFDQVLIFLFLLVVIIAFIDPFTTEGFVEKSECSDGNCDDTTLLEVNNELLQSPKRYMSVQNFNKMVLTIQMLVIQKITELAKTCYEMNGSDGVQKGQMLFTCLLDTDDIQEQVIDVITAYVIDTIRTMYGINLNPYIVHSDFMNQLDLLDSVVYPLLYSKHYTVHGANYFTAKMLTDKVQQNLKINDILYTTLLRRGIDVLADNDEHGSDMVDYRYIMVLAITVLIFMMIYTQTGNIVQQNITNYNPSIMYDKKATDLSIYVNPNAKDIKIDDDTYQKMLDAVTNYSLTSSDRDRKLVMIYLATFHLFDMNFEYSSVKNLDDQLTTYPYLPNHIEFPVGDLHQNIQKAIISHISKHLSSSERELTTDGTTDREILDVYLKNLFRGIGVM